MNNPLFSFAQSIGFLWKAVKRRFRQWTKPVDNILILKVALDRLCAGEKELYTPTSIKGWFIAGTGMMEVELAGGIYNSLGISPGCFYMHILTLMLEWTGVFDHDT